MFKYRRLRFIVLRLVYRNNCAIRASGSSSRFTHDDNAGWGLRCGDDGSERSRGTLPNPSSPPVDVSLLTPVDRTGLAGPTRSHSCSFLPVQSTGNGVAL